MEQNEFEENPEFYYERLEIFPDFIKKIQEYKLYIAHLKIEDLNFALIPVTELYMYNVSPIPNEFEIASIAINIFGRPTLMGQSNEDKKEGVVDRQQYIEKRFKIERFIKTLNLKPEYESILIDSFLIPIMYSHKHKMVQINGESVLIYFNVCRMLRAAGVITGDSEKDKFLSSHLYQGFKEHYEFEQGEPCFVPIDILLDNPIKVTLTTEDESDEDGGPDKQYHKEDRIEDLVDVSKLKSIESLYPPTKVVDDLLKELHGS